MVYPMKQRHVEICHATLWLTKEGITAFPNADSLFVSIRGHDLQLSDAEIKIKAELWTEYRNQQQPQNPYTKCHL